MKASLSLRQTHRLSMTPELRQALGLLQMSALELRDTVREALEHNLLLEKIDDSNDAPPTPGEDGPPPDADSRPGDGAAEEWPVAEWDSTEVILTGGDGGEADAPEPETQPGVGLREHLLLQLDLAHLNARDTAIGTLLIDSLNDDGYLAESLDELRLACGDNDSGPEPEEMEAVLHRLQSFDPTGVGARDLRECLDLQLRPLPATPARELALTLVNEHLQELAAHAHVQLCRTLEVSAAELETAIALIQSLNPRPGTALTAGAVDFVIPDVLASRRDGRWVVELNPETAPRLHVNTLYAAALGRRHREQHGDLGRQLQEARWLVRSLKMRNETLLRVAQCLVRHQAHFLSEGEEAMRPLMLKNVAAELGLHESTISRVVANKYLATPRGTLAFRHFFSNELSTDDGGARSATAIRALIRKLVAQEDPHRPLSDDRITRELVSRGIRVARRTVAKYRESMTIPPAHERKRLATR